MSQDREAQGSSRAERSLGGLRGGASNLQFDFLALIAWLFNSEFFRWLVSTAALGTALWGVVTVVPMAVDPLEHWTRDDLRVAAVPFVVSIGVFCFYIFGTWVSKTRSSFHRTEPLLQISQEDVDEVYSRIEVDGQSTAALYFLQLVCRPNSRYERITESVTPLTRSTLVRTTFTLAVSDEEEPGVALVLPLVMQRKGSLLHGVKFLNSSGERISSLTQRVALAYGAAVIRYLIGRIGADALSRYTESIEPHVINLIAGTDVVSPEFDEGVKAVENDILDLPVTQPNQVEVLNAVILLLARLRKRFAICVVLENTGSGPTQTGDHYMRVTVERRIVGTIVERRPYLRGGVWPVVAWSWIRYRARRFVDGLRRALGIRPAVVQFSLENADRAASYHLEVKGPDGTYLAAQELTKYRVEGEEWKAQQLAFQSRLGQRHSHLYVRAGKNFLSYVLVNRFYERMPGSMAPATVSAFASTVVIWICAAVQLSWVSADLARTDLIAVLLALPAVAAAWIGLDREGSLRGGVLAARVSGAITMATSLSAALAYLLDLNEGVRRGVWIGLALVISINLVGSFGSWQLRSWTSRYFVERVLQDERVLREEF